MTPRHQPNGISLDSRWGGHYSLSHKDPRVPFSAPNRRPQDGRVKPNRNRCRTRGGLERRGIVEYRYTHQSTVEGVDDGDDDGGDDVGDDGDDDDMTMMP